MCSTRCGASGTSGPRRRGAQWAEIDLPARVWTVPAVRMKSKREHRVPLCGRAAEILEAALAHVVGEFIRPPKGSGWTALNAGEMPAQTCSSGGVG